MQEEVILYTTHCPKCRVVEMKLKQKGVNYEECDDVDKMLNLGLTSAPAIQVGDRILDFVEAVEYINKL